MEAFDSLGWMAALQMKNNSLNCDYKPRLHVYYRKAHNWREKERKKGSAISTVHNLA